MNKKQMPGKSNPILAFFAYAYNLAETTRAIEIARVLLNTGIDIRFLTHGGPYEAHIIESGFPLTTLQPIITPDKHEYLIGLDQGRQRGAPFTSAELKAYVESELHALKAIQPVAVYAGMNLPCAISARAANLPLIYLLPVQGTVTYFLHNLATFPDSHENWVTHFMPQRWKNRLFNRFMSRLRIGLKTFNHVAGQYGLSPVRSVWNVVSGDLTLLSDLPELTGLPAAVLPANHHYIGPLFAKLPLSVPDKVRQVFSRPGLNVFCAMGSSAPAYILRETALALRDSEYNVVIATTTILDPSELDPLPENVYATRYLPAPQVNEIADVAVIHGGQGTVQTACWAGTPIVGMALQYEQQSNLDMLVRAGMGVRIPLNSFTGAKVLSEIKNVTNSVTYRQNARRIQALMRDVDGATNAAKIILDFIRPRNSF